MKGKKNINGEFNEAFTTVEVFIEYYNKNIPATYPKATEKALAAFRVSYPGLFEKGESWSIDKHRKRLMDWLTSYHEAIEQK
ncbi:MAG: hypothetical protein WCT49_01090 [Candidatus Paceibacterota bacterium]